MAIPTMAKLYIDSGLAHMATFQSMTLRGPKTPACFLTQFDFLKLARTGHRKFVNQEDVTRNFVACNSAAAMVVDPPLRDALPGHRLNESHGDLAQARVGDPTTAAALIAGWPRGRLDLQRIDVLATDLEHVLVAAHKAQVPIDRMNPISPECIQPSASIALAVSSGLR